MLIFLNIWQRFINCTERFYMKLCCTFSWQAQAGAHNTADVPEGGRDWLPHRLLRPADVIHCQWHESQRLLPRLQH